jgi:ligand-binding sensor domain-containing protein
VSTFTVNRGTYNGLNRFDGNNFKSFTEDSHGLYTNSVSRIIPTSDSMLLLYYSDVINQVSNVEIFNPESTPTSHLFAQNSFFVKNINQNRTKSQCITNIIFIK